MNGHRNEWHGYDTLPGQLGRRDWLASAERASAKRLVLLLAAVFAISLLIFCAGSLPGVEVL